VIVGTGGIGTGKIYRLEGNEPLGRNETRFGHLLDQKDFCKLHIVFHYIAVLLSGIAPNVSILPVGGVGDDAEGEEVLRLVSEAGMTSEYIRTIPGTPTLTALCYQFPDGSGGNITERESASSKISPEDIGRVSVRLKGKRVLTAALPEVPLETRVHLLKAGRKLGAVNAASFVSGEMEQVKELNIIPDVDILALNIDEAAALISTNLSGVTGPDLALEEWVDSCFRYVSERNSTVKCIITAGKQGFYGYHQGQMAHFPPLDVSLTNSAGAGDALLAGVIIGETLGLPFFPSAGASTLHLANCLAAQSVEAPDTINFHVSIDSFRSFCGSHGHSEIEILFQKSSS